jgi:hypothetical protein
MSCISSNVILYHNFFVASGKVLINCFMAMLLAQLGHPSYTEGGNQEHV